MIAEGEVLQLETSNNTETTEDAYLEVITAKTAALFAAACRIGAVVANRPKAEETALESFGKNLGIAFQLVDDALDYSARQATLGKSIGDDFREGKITLPLVLAFRRGSEEERQFWRCCVEAGRQEAADLEQAIELMDRHGALTDTVERGPPLRRHGPRRPRDLPRQPDQAGARRRHRLLHRAGALKRGRHGAATACGPEPAAL